MDIKKKRTKFNIIANREAEKMKNYFESPAEADKEVKRLENVVKKTISGTNTN